MKKFKRLTALALATVMVASVSTTVAFAEDSQQSDTNWYVKGYTGGYLSNVLSTTGSSAALYVSSDVDGSYGSSETITKTGDETKGVKVYASTTDDGDAITDGTAADYGISYTVIIPQSIHLVKGSKGTGTYSQTFDIAVLGDIGTAQTLTVVPGRMEDTGFESGVVTLKGSKFASGTVNCKVATTAENASQSYSRDDLISANLTATNYTATADLTPGDWVGYMEVNITLETASNTAASGT
jgi:hypothetical protein